MFESPVTFILYTFASNVSPVPYVKLSSRRFGETVCNSMFWQIVLKKSYGSDVDTNYHHDIVQTHDADSGMTPTKCQNCCTWARIGKSDVRPPSQLIADEPPFEWFINCR